MAILNVNPYRSPHVESQPARGRLNLVLFGLLVGVAVHIVEEARSYYGFASGRGLDLLLTVMRDNAGAIATGFAINLVWRAGTGAVVGAIASRILARRKMSG